jgi:hypothetical protein
MANPQQMRELSTNNNAKSCLHGLEWAQEGKRAGRDWLTMRPEWEAKAACGCQGVPGVWIRRITAAAIWSAERAPRGGRLDQGVHDERHTQLDEAFRDHGAIASPLPIVDDRTRERELHEPLQRLHCMVRRDHVAAGLLEMNRQMGCDNVISLEQQDAGELLQYHLPPSSRNRYTTIIRSPAMMSMRRIAQP